MIVYRCVHTKYVSEPLSGMGAEVSGGRFNSIHVPVIYTAEHRAMAIFEVLIRVPLQTLVATHAIIPVEVPDKPISQISAWSKNWKDDVRKCRQLGDGMLSDPSHTLVKVPSSLLNNCFNYLLNPHAHDFGRIKASPPEPIIFDERLLKKLINLNKA